MNTDSIEGMETCLAVMKAVKGLPANITVNSILLAAFLMCDEYGLNKTNTVYDALGAYEMAKEIVEKEED